jgi:transposase
VFTDLRKRKLFEMARGKDKKSLIEQVKEIPGKENVEIVVIDLSNGYHGFVRQFFPNAKIIADKFHALRLVTPALLKKRKEIHGHRQDLKTRKLLLKSRYDLDYSLRSEIDYYLKDHPDLKELYWAKEKLQDLYRTRGQQRARESLERLLATFNESKQEAIQKLKRTLNEWGDEILNYFETRFTNGLTEAINATAKLVQRRAYGYRSFKNYRLRTLSACT